MDKLIAKRGNIKGGLTRMKNVLTPEFVANASLQMLLAREEKVVSLYSEFESLSLDINDNEDPTIVEQHYYDCIDVLRTEIAGRSKKPECNKSPISKIKLPDVQIPTFDGKYLDFRPFIELFNALIDKDEGLDDIQKFFYLRHFLKGEALELVKNLPVVGTSYQEALNILKERFDNKNKIVFEHISNLFDLQCMTNSNVTSLRELISDAKQHVAALKNLGQPVQTWDSILVCLLSRKLDPATNKAYHLERDQKSTPTFANFISFLETRALALESSSDAAAPSSSKKPLLPEGKPKVVNVVVKQSPCLFCGKLEHKIFLCPKFMLASVAERLKFVKEKGVCSICLNSHAAKCRFHFKCKQCKMSHNTLLHNESESETPKEEPVSLMSGSGSQNQVLLPTAQVKVVCKNGKELIVKALLDSASQSSFITNKIAKMVGTNLLPTSTDVLGIANTEKRIKYSMPIDIFSLIYPYKVNVNCLVVEKITTKLPQVTIPISNLNIPQNVKLADDTFNVSSEIDILLGADILFQTILPQPEQLLGCDAAQPRLIHTQFGYIVAGNITGFSHQNTSVSLLCQDCNSNVSNTINNFWQSESVPELFTEYTSEQHYCEQYFKDTVLLKDNKFEVSLPLKVPIFDINNTLGNSLGLALKRFINLEKRFEKDQLLFQQYQGFIHEYIALGHASYIDISEYDLSKDPVYFLPHHPVIREDAISTKLRVVFDGSMKTANKTSLNDLLLNGPIVQPELFDTLLSFRVYKYFFICDIRRMFRNISVDKSQRSLQNILWRDNPKEPIKCVQLNTVTYGLKNSSFLSTRCLKELAVRYNEDFPLASTVILNSTYVDDILHSDDSLHTIIHTKKQLIDLLAKGSFSLHKWSSNDESILSGIPVEQQCFGELEFQKDIKTLGLKFDINTDSFKMSPPVQKEIPKTKRQILSFISQFYDPLGFAGPVFVQAKTIMQKLWLSNVDWDSNPPPSLTKEWKDFYENLISMPTISIKRNACIDNQQTTQLVGFSDASLTAYGCAIYLRTIDKTGNVNMALLCSKSRINPKDCKLTIPRLELNSALLMAKLAARAHTTLQQKIDVQGVHLFTDSQVVLAWLETGPAKLNAYVANRIKLIKDNTKHFNWSYINTDQNPADCLSRGLNPSELQGHHLWWQGPQGMSNSDYNFPDCNQEVPSDLPEMKAPKVVCAASQTKGESFLDFVYKYSSVHKAQRILSYVLRFCHNVRPNSQKIKQSFISHAESQKALHLILKNEQNKFFKNDIVSLKAGKQASSALKGLNPFIDANGILRVGGRLHNAALPYSQKHQIILPKDSQITQSLVISEHLKLLHAGQKLVLSSLNQQYWIVNGLRFVKKVIYKCVTCFRFKAITAQQLMGSLPADRLNAKRVFEKIGIDFAGPVLLKQSRVRSVIKTKGYIAVYVCFVTKAIHIELVSDLTTDTFLASFKRFIGRRNVPTEVYCDNAGTFKAANTQLTELYKLYNSKNHQTQVQNVASQLGVNFHFIPSYSPVFGGLWEAAVKSVKYHLKRVLGSHILTYEQMYTVLVQIEGILNSRPLTPMSSDVDDLSFLTPGHFLTGAPLNCYPEHDLKDIPENKLKFWAKCTALKQQFWRYWSKQYLNVLQNRPKWKDNLPNVQVGSLVILKELDTPPMTWPMARVTKVYPGDDGKVRALEVKKANGRCHKTSITKICILPLD